MLYFRRGLQMSPLYYWITCIWEENCSILDDLPSIGKENKNAYTLVSYNNAKHIYMIAVVYIYNNYDAFFFFFFGFPLFFLL